MKYLNSLNRFDALEAKINTLETKLKSMESSDDPILNEKYIKLGQQRKSFVSEMSSNSLSNKKNDVSSSFVTRSQFESFKFELEELVHTLEEKILIKNEKPVNVKEKQSTMVKEAFVSWSERMTVNCYNKIFHYENIFVKLFWLFILVGSLGVTAWILSGSIFNYLFLCIFK